MNDPLLYINSVSDKNEGSSNQEYYDSREISNKKKLIKHRIEDLRAMMFFKFKIYVIILTNEGKVEGIVNNVDDGFIYINKKETIKKVNIIDIEDILIKKM